MEKMSKKTLFVVQAAMIAAIYVVLTVGINAFGLASGAIQVRISEALCVLPIFTPAAIPGLFVGCLLSNTITGCALWDIVFGSLATLAGALGTRALRHTKFVFTLPPVLANAIVVPVVLRMVYGLEDAYWYLVATVGAGEILSICIIGFVLALVLRPYAKVIFGND